MAPPKDVMDEMQVALERYRDIAPMTDSRRRVLDDFDFARDAMELRTYLLAERMSTGGGGNLDDGIRLCEDYLRDHAGRIVAFLEESAALARRGQTQRWMAEAEGKR